MLIDSGLTNESSISVGPNLELARLITHPLDYTLLTSSHMALPGREQILRSTRLVVYFVLSLTLWEIYVF